MLWLVGFAIEFAADYQKHEFLQDANNQGKFIKSGVWSVSRHPNYFGEIREFRLDEPTLTTHIKYSGLVCSSQQLGNSLSWRSTHRVCRSCSFTICCVTYPALTCLRRMAKRCVHALKLKHIVVFQALGNESRLQEVLWYDAHFSANGAHLQVAAVLSTDYVFHSSIFIKSLVCHHSEIIWV